MGFGVQGFVDNIFSKGFSKPPTFRVVKSCVTHLFFVGLQGKDCTLRPAQLPDQCLTWVTGLGGKKRNRWTEPYEIMEIDQNPHISSRVV